MRWNARRLHRLLVPVAALPLILTALSGSLFSVLESRGIKVRWLLQIHRGDFGLIDLEPWYPLLLGVLTLVLTISGLNLYLRSRRQPSPGAS